MRYYPQLRAPHTNKKWKKWPSPSPPKKEHIINYHNKYIFCVWYKGELIVLHHICKLSKLFVCLKKDENQQVFCKLLLDGQLQ